MNLTFASAAALCAAACTLVPVARAQAVDPAAELQRLQQQMTQMRADYEARMQALERQLQALQSSAAAAPAVPAAPAAAAPPAVATAGPPRAGSAAYNPAISLILNGTYAHLKQDPGGYRLLGFMPSGGEVGPGVRGLQLGESELGLSASIDPTFSGRLTIALGSDDSVGIEEAYFEGQGLLGAGTTLRAGRFLSGIGYLNGVHAHAWDFVDAPLAYQAFFGGALRTDGVQLRWLAPTDRYLELGAEIGAGRDFPGAESGRGNGIGSSALHAHLGDDLGDSASWKAGLSYVRHRASDRRYDDVDSGGNPWTNSYSGRSTTWGLDGVLKWAPGGNATRTSLKLQGELFQRRESGRLNFDIDGAAAGGDYRATQTGWYLQAVYQFMPRWRVGLRHDRLDSGTPRIGAVDGGQVAVADIGLLQSARPSRSSAMLDYTLSEFSRFRLQVANDRSNPGAADRQLYLQYIMSLGAHGAHGY